MTVCIAFILSFLDPNTNYAQKMSTDCLFDALRRVHPVNAHSFEFWNFADAACIIKLSGAG